MFSYYLLIKPIIIQFMIENFYAKFHNFTQN